MTPTQIHRTFQTMERFGGHFCCLLATAWYEADPFHRSCIEQAFPHLLSRYGPGSNFYTACHEPAVPV